MNGTGYQACDSFSQDATARTPRGVPDEKASVTDMPGDAP